MNFQCQFCKKDFKRESALMQHHCNAKEKHDTLQQPLGQAAYAYYSQWMIEYKRKVPPIETFGDSRYFKSFVDFAKFVQDLQIPNTQHFIRLMKDKDISPMLWTKNECYKLYLEFLDIGVDPMDMVQVSIDTLMRKQDELQVADLGAALVSLHINELIHLLRVKKISPWLLLCSRTFRSYLLALTDDERNLLMKIIVPEYWADKLKHNPGVVTEIKMLVQELGLNN